MSSRKLPAPFPDLATDRRAEGRIEVDRPAVERAARRLEESAGEGTLDREFVYRMQQRREDPDRFLQLEIATTVTGQQTLVVQGELLVRTSGPIGDPGVVEILSQYTPVDSADPKRDSGGPADGNDAERAPARDSETGDPAEPAPYTGPSCVAIPTLAPLLTRYVARDRDAEQRRKDIAALAEFGVIANLTAVVALQKKPTIVVKSGATGPAPTEVVDSGFNCDVADGTPRRRVRVAVIDTGIVEELRSDGWLNDVARVLDPSNIDPLDAFPPNSLPPPRGNGLLDFGAGHGTFAAGIVRQVDPWADIRVYSALDSDGLGSELGLASAMIQAVLDGAEVLNVSLGARTVDNQPPLAIEVALDLIDALTEGREAPVLVAAAGNFGDDVPVWPAASRRVIAVAALTKGELPTTWSSRGVWVDCSTVGEGIVSTFVTGREDPDFGDETDPNNDEYLEPAWAIWSGTSFAAPQIAGQIARTMRETGLSPRSAARRVVRDGFPIADFGRARTILPGT